MAAMAAKYDGFCRKCRQKFPAGTMITWSKQAGSAHDVCPAASETSAATSPSSKPAAPAVSIEAAPFEAIERFEPCRRPMFEAQLKARIGETLHYTRRGPVRRGTPGADRAEPGYYVVVGSGRTHYQNAEENEDMGDMSGANWQAQLFLRAATPVEIEAAQHQELAGQIGPIFTAMMGMVRRGEERRAKEAFETTASRPGWTKVEVGCLDELGPAAMAARKTATTLWAGTDRDHSYVQSFALGDDTIVESYKYVYDWDLPREFAVPVALAEQVRLVQAIVRFGWAVKDFVRKHAQPAKLAA